MTERIIEISKQAIREEVAWRRREGLPILIWKDGKVVDINKPRRGRAKKKAGGRKRARGQTRR
jgi:hypothetical protein